MSASAAAAPVLVGVAAPGKLAILIDGQCDLCVKGARWISKGDKKGAIEILDLHDPAASARFPEIEPARLMEEMHAVDERGSIYRGARAINEVMRWQGGLKSLLAYLWYVPGYAWLANRQYKRIAASRYQLSARNPQSGAAVSR